MRCANLDVSQLRGLRCPLTPVDYSDEQEGVVLQVDGEAIGRDDLWTLLSTYEGFEVTIEISDL